MNELGFQGCTDVYLFKWAQEHSAIIITYDEDFADARFYRLGANKGVIRLRVWPTSTESTINAIQRLLRQLPPEKWVGRLIIIDNQKIRVREPRG